MKKPDILMFMSDQHTPYYSGYYGHNVDTPNIDQLALDGTRFDEAYTACPICVPSLVAMLSAMRPSKTGVFGLDDALSDMTPTFLNYLVKEGYETVLVGRMHYVGHDQRHGFTKRIAPDCTTITWNRPEQLKESRGVYHQTFSGGFPTVVGGGESPAEYYDKLVIEKALEYLSHDYGKPQFIVVSIYAPHHPYVGPVDLYRKYQQRVKLPESYYDPVEVAGWKLFQKNLPKALHLDIAAAYSAMIEEMDERMGRVRKAFDEFCARNNSKKLFIYVSDHGDMMGDRGSYNKQTFYEKSVKIPLIFAGDGVERNNVINDAVNIMDLG
ncbi:MAG: sulfatase-like hydrolase/transferase, partial [Erysipelotrichaceae bacterium]|nr:sulfatase-like hydrolase/transferase [Erysipelotrichaceae bacterium]